MDDGRDPVAYRAGEGLGRDGSLMDGKEVSCLEAMTLPGKVTRPGEEEKMCKP